MIDLRTNTRGRRHEHNGTEYKTLALLAQTPKMRRREGLLLESCWLEGGMRWEGRTLQSQAKKGWACLSSGGHFSISFCGRN